jgi:hypothetical protein
VKFLGSSKKNSPLVGPVIRSLYDSVSTSNRPAFKKYLLGAPSGCEIVATYKNASIDIAQTILTKFKRTGLPGGVAGAQVFPDGFAIYIKGDFSEDAFAALTRWFMQSGDEFGVEVTVASGRFEADTMRQLP